MCDEGYYCTSGVDVPKPLLLNDTQCLLDRVHQSVGDLCPVGYFCLSGSGYPQPCPAGYYQNTAGSFQCKSCPAGYYCVANTSDYSPHTCPGGYFCPLNTEYPYQHPCLPGTFNNLTQQHGPEACQPCPPGKYCQGYGNDYWTGDCDPGYYCLNGSDQGRVRMTSADCIYSAMKMPLISEAYLCVFNLSKTFDVYQSFKYTHI